MPELAHGESEGSVQLLRGLAGATALVALVMGIEAVGALLSRSLSVAADAVHNGPDLLAFVVSYYSLAATARGRSQADTFGTHRLEVFAALLNAFILLATGLLFAYPALLGLAQGTALAGPVEPGWILAAAVPTLFLRSAAAAYLGRLPREARELNVRSVLIHLGADVAITAALLADATVLFFRPGALWVDPAVALVVVAVLIYEAVPILRSGYDVLSERVPRGVALEAVERSIRSAPHVRELHDLHVWSVCPTLVCLTAHVVVDDMSLDQSSEVTSELRRRVEREFGILHSVFEIEPPSRRDSQAPPPSFPGSAGVAPKKAA